MQNTFNRSFQFSSVTKSCPTPASPWPAAHQASLSIINSWSLLKLTCIMSVIAIQTSHPLSSPSPPAFKCSQHQGLSQPVGSSHQVAKVLGVSASPSVLPMNTQDWSPLGLTGWISLQPKGLSSVFSNTTVQFFSTQLSLVTSLVAQMVKCLSTMQETRVWSLGQEDPLEKEMAIHSNSISWKMPWTEEPGRLQSMGSQRVGHDWATSLFTFSFLYSPTLTSIHDHWKNHSLD